jgi:hypothetical protein
MSAGAIGLGRRRPTACDLTRCRRRTFGSGGRGKTRLGLGTRGLKARPPASSGARSRLFLCRSSFDIVQEPSRRLDLGLARGRRTPRGRPILIVCLRGTSQRGELGQRVGKLSLRRAKRGPKVQIGRRHRDGQRSPSRLALSRSGRSFIDEPPPVPVECLDLGDESSLTHLRRRRGHPRIVVLRAALALEGGPPAQLG